MTTGDIVEHLEEVYDTTISRDLVSTVTEKVTKDMQAWQTRPLDPGRFLPIVVNPDWKESQCHVGRGTRRMPTSSAVTSS